MKLIINGPIKPYYIQMLVMLYFPGEKFPEEASSEDETRYTCVDVQLKEDGVYSHVTVADNGKHCEGEAYMPYGILDREKIVNFAAGGAVLKAFTALTGHNPPWGILTGVRPARLATELFERDVRGEDAISFFKNVYLTTEQKARLAVSTAETSQLIVTPESYNECSVYISIPFCPTRCAYCSFVSATSPKLLAMIPEYLKELTSDIDRTFELIEELGIRVASVYIGGGTPTVLNETELEVLLSCISSHINSVDEFTLEAGRPDTINSEKLRIAKQYGVTRISVNTQTLNDSVLENIGRAHTSDDFFRAYALAAKSGIRDINVDLIAGLPGDTVESFRSSIDRVIELDPTNITVHSFSVKRSAEFKTGGHNVYDRDGQTAFLSVEYSEDKLISSGYIPYYMYRQKNTVGNLENVGYSKKGHEGLYNIYMMDEIHSIFACGAAAVTKIVSFDPDGNQKIERIFEPKYPYEYLKNRSSPDFEEALRKNKEFIRNIYGK